MRYRMMVLDLDGTVVGSSGRVSSRTRQAVRACREAGMLVVVATGRRVRAALPALHDLGLDGPTILCNGALTLDMATGHTLGHAPLRAAGTAAALLWQRSGLAPLACLPNQRGIDLLCHHLPAARPQWLRDDIRHGRVGTGEDVTALAHRALKLMLVGEADRLRALAAVFALPGRLMVSVDADGMALAELWRDDVNKGVAVRSLAQRLGIDRREIVAFGDNENDLELLAYAGLGVAVGNAIPAAKAAARMVCGPCDADGVAEVLESLARNVAAAAV